MSRIETHRSRVPWTWAAGIALPWMVLFLSDNITQEGPLVFTIRKFAENPQLIALLTSLQIGFNLITGVAASYVSDRIWTRYGRRRPFLLAGWAGVGLTLACMPLARGIWSLAALVVAFQFFQSLTKPFEPLYNEVIPPPQRGRAMTMRALLQTLTGLLFFGVLLAQFDRTYQIGGAAGFRLTGEQVLYGGSAVLTLVVLAFIGFGVRERRVAVEARPEPLGLRQFVRDVFGERQWWMLYALYAAPSLCGVGSDSFNMLVRTEQLGFTKPQIGWATSVAMLTNAVVFLPLAGFLTDRVSRLRLFQVGLAGPALLNFGLFCFVRLAPPGTMPYAGLLAFSIAGGAMQACLWTTWGPLVYDYVPSKRFGTVAAGFALVGSAVSFLFLNGGGFWIEAFTGWFGSAGGTRFDYSSIFVFQALGTVAGVAVTWWFAHEERRGRVLALGRDEKDSFQPFLSAGESH